MKKHLHLVILFISVCAIGFSQNTNTPKISTPPRYADGSIYLTLTEFRNAPADKQDHILKHAEVYVIIADSVAKPKALISRKEFHALSPAKQRSFLDTNAYEISE